MKKINTIKKNEEFQRIIKNYPSIKTKHFYIYIEKRENTVYHFGISVSKKLGNAVLRNKYKRIIKHIIDKKVYKNSFNCIIILKKSAITEKYINIENDLLSAFYELKIIEE